jgi:hypothetical protein
VAIFLIGSSVVVRPSVDSGLVPPSATPAAPTGRGAFHDVADAVRRRLPRQEQVGEREPLEQLVDDTRDDLRDGRGDRAAAAAGALQQRALRLQRDRAGREALPEAGRLLPVRLMAAL